MVARLGCMPEPMRILAWRLAPKLGMIWHAQLGGVPRVGVI